MTIEFRRITPADVGQVADFACSALKTANAVPLHIDMHKIRTAVRFFADAGPEHFQMAAFRDGQPVAALAALAQEMPFFERCDAQVFICYSVEPGAGVRLLRAMLRWFHADFRLRRLMWMMNEGREDTARKMARIFGFTHGLHACVLYK